MPPVLTEKLMGLPRWAWALMLAGGVGIGLYLRTHEHGTNAGKGTEAESLNSGNLVPPAGPIEGSGGGGGGGTSEINHSVAPDESPKPEIEPETAQAPEADEVELPESRPPLEPVVQGGSAGRKGEPVRAESLGGGSGVSHKIGEAVKVAGPDNKAEQEKRANEINRLQSEIGNLRSENERLNGEINNLQNSINTLTGYIQAHPRATQKGQWENERNQDRTNIEGKRSKVDQNNANISHKQDEMTYWSAH